MISKADNTAGNRQKLIKATIELMSSRGFEAMGINSILEAAGVTKSNFYYHFKSKEDLCLSALDVMSQYFFDEYVDPILLDKSLRPKARLQKFLDSKQKKMQADSCKKGCAFVNLAAETSDFLPAFRERIDSFFIQYQKKLANCYKEGIEKGEFRSDIEPNAAALALLACINGTLVLAKARKKPQIIKESIQTILLLLATSK